MGKEGLLASEVRKRRAELGRSQEEVVQAAARRGHEMSVNTVRAVEYDQRTTLRSSTRRALAAGLDWPVSAVDALLEGRIEPTPPSSDDLRAMIREVAREEGFGQSDKWGELIRSFDAGQRKMFVALLDGLRSGFADEA